MTSVAIAVAMMLVGAAVAFIYMTNSVNAIAGRQDHRIETPSIRDDAAGFRRAFAGAVGDPAFEGNEVDLYQNGDEIFPPMLQAIENSRETIHFSTFVFDAGIIPEQFGEAFVRAAQRGVEVKMLLDSDGAKKVPPSLVARLRAAGCDLKWFRKAEWFDWTKYNRRMHTKLLVVDGSIGFTGGAGIGDDWRGDGRSPGQWRDTHARFIGPAAAGLQAAFVENWNETSGELPVRAAHFPAIRAAGEVPVCVVQSNPSNGTSAAQRAMATLIGGAAQTLWITNAYFIPSAPFIRALVAARARGVDVKILVPGPFHNKPAVRRASRRTWRRLLTGGVEIYEYQPAMVHAKVVVVDGSVTMLGSINFDPRSFTLNAECSAACFSETVSAKAASAFASDLSLARRMTVADLDAASVWSNALDSVCHWVRAQL